MHKLMYQWYACRKRNMQFSTGSCALAQRSAHGECCMLLVVRSSGAGLLGWHHLALLVWV
jgi:hypothetical protein